MFWELVHDNTQNGMVNAIYEIKTAHVKNMGIK